MGNLFDNRLCERADVLSIVMPTPANLAVQGSGNPNVWTASVAVVFFCYADKEGTVKLGQKAMDYTFTVPTIPNPTLTDIMTAFNNQDFLKWIAKQQSLLTTAPVTGATN